MTKLTVDIWSDIACPWCYIGKRRLESAIEKLDRPVEIRWRAFELDPEAPPERDRSVGYAERLAKKYGIGVEQAEGRLGDMTRIAAEDGLDFRFDRVRSGNTFDAHRLIHLATELGRADLMKERLLRAYMTEGAPIGDRETLIALGIGIGLDEARVRRVLDSDEYAVEVRADERQAQELGIRGVPFFVVGNKYGVSGAQPAEALLEVLQQALAEVEASEPTVGASCGPDGCA